MTIRCVAFDFDGTLVDSAGIKHRAFYEVVEDDAQLEPALTDLLRHDPPLDRYEVFARLARTRADAGPDDADLLAASWVKRYTELVERRIAECADIPGADVALRSLSERGLDLGIVSDTPQDSLLRVVTPRPWSALVPEVRGRPPGKTEQLQRLMAQHGIAPHELVLVGDAASDRHAAERAGCHFVEVGRNEPPVRRWPTLPALFELPDVVEELGSTPPPWSSVRHQAGEQR